MSTDQPVSPASNEIAKEIADATPQIKTAWLDRIPVAYRHFLIMGIASGLGVLGNDIKALHLTHLEAGGAALALTFLTEYFTPLTRQFGVGK
jgi:hypothetical protein